MKHSTQTLLTLCGCLFLSWNVCGQELLQLNFHASTLYTNDAGKIARSRIDNDTLVRQYAEANGATNDLSSLELVYSVNGDERGDVIEVVNRNDGTVMWPVFALFFPVDLPSGDGSRLERYTQLFNNQKSESIGSARMSERIRTDRNGNSSRIIHGQLQFYLLPEGQDGLRMCDGTFIAAQPFTTNSVANPTPGSGGR